MEKVTKISATEHEIVMLIAARWPELDYTSIVAGEEIGNHNLDLTVSPITDNEASEFEEDLKTRSGYKYRLREMLDTLCKEGVLEAGDYTIDCTW